MSGEDGLELRNAHVVRLLQTPKGSVVEIAHVTGSAVAICDNATIDASRVAVPDIQIYGGDRLAGRTVNDLYIQS